MLGGSHDNVSGSSSVGHQMSAESVKDLLLAMRLGEDDTAVEVGFGNYPRLAAFAAMVTRRTVIATDVKGRFYYFLYVYFIS